MLSMVFCMYERFISWKVPLMLICAGIVLNFKGLPSGRVIDCTLPMPGTLVTALVILSITRKSAELRRSLIRLDEQHLGVHSGDREMSLGRREALLRRQVSRQVLAVVVAGLVARQGQ